MDLFDSRCSSSFWESLLIHWSRFADGIVGLCYRRILTLNGRKLSSSVPVTQYNHSPLLCLSVLPTKSRRTSYFTLCWFTQPPVKTDPLMLLSSNLTPRSHACVWFQKHTDRKNYSGCKDWKLADACFWQRCAWQPGRPSSSVAATLQYMANRLQCSHLHRLGKQHLLCLNSTEKGFTSWCFNHTIINPPFLTPQEEWLWQFQLFCYFAWRHFANGLCGN